MKDKECGCSFNYADNQRKSRTTGQGDKNDEGECCIEVPETAKEALRVLYKLSDLELEILSNKIPQNAETKLLKAASDLEKPKIKEVLKSSAKWEPPSLEDMKRTGSQLSHLEKLDLYHGLHVKLDRDTVSDALLDLSPRDQFYALGNAGITSIPIENIIRATNSLELHEIAYVIDNLSFLAVEKWAKETSPTKKRDLVKVLQTCLCDKAGKGDRCTCCAQSGALGSGRRGSCETSTQTGNKKSGGFCFCGGNLRSSSPREGQCYCGLNKGNDGCCYCKASSRNQIQRTTLQGSQDRRSTFQGSQDRRSIFQGSQDRRSTFHGSQDRRSTFQGSQDRRSTFQGSQDRRSTFQGSQNKRGTFRSRVRPSENTISFDRIEESPEENEEEVTNGVEESDYFEEESAFSPSNSSSVEITTQSVENRRSETEPTDNRTTVNRTISSRSSKSRKSEGRLSESDYSSNPFE